MRWSAKPLITGSNPVTDFKFFFGDRVEERS